ncbi:MAG: DUF2145 domain-containing protein [Cytophagales bacterium]|nr:DUF2145 domain-containing protein [Rhizobacter sp.]
MSLAWPARAALLFGLFASLFASLGVQAASLRFCDRPLTLSAEHKDKLFRFGGVIKAELEQSGQGVALMSRSGLDLSRFGQRYSHAGFSLKASPDTPWAVRQLYYACDERRPRIFDQGVSGFLLGTENPAIGYVSVVFMPAAAAAPLERAARDNRQALALLGSTYSANAHAFSQRYQNCNQWVAEMLAAAWGGSPADDIASSRVAAQQWLKGKGYLPTLFDAGDRLLLWLATAFVPWLHSDDHPSDDLHQAHYRISMPASIEAFIHETVPGATRVEFCHTEQHIVIRRGWVPIAEGCVPGTQDTVVTLD